MCAYVYIRMYTSVSSSSNNYEMVLDRTFSSLTRVQDGSLQTQYRFKDGALACMSEMHFYQSYVCNRLHVLYVK